MARVSTQKDKSNLQGNFRLNPHSYLGLHPFDEDSNVIRLYRPGADAIYIQLRNQPFRANKISEEGIFECIVPKEISFLDYQIYHQNGLLSFDPYSFEKSFGDLDAHLFSNGVHYKLYNVLGARLHQMHGCYGVKFALWAPSAKRVSVVGDFNH